MPVVQPTPYTGVVGAPTLIGMFRVKRGIASRTSYLANSVDLSEFRIDDMHSQKFCGVSFRLLGSALVGLHFRCDWV